MFSTPIIEKTEIIIDEDPNIYIRRAEDFLIKGLWFESLRQCNIAVKIANDKYMNKSHYLFECAKILFRLHKYDECAIMIEEHLENFKKDFNISKFSKVEDYLLRSKNMINYQSLYIVNDKITIKYSGNENVKSVYVIGDFTEWYENPAELYYDGNEWSLKIVNLFC